MSFPEALALGAEPPDHFNAVAGETPSIVTALIFPVPLGSIIRVNDTDSPLARVPLTPVKFTVTLLEGSLPVYLTTFPLERGTSVFAESVVPKLLKFSTRPALKIAVPVSAIRSLSVGATSVDVDLVANDKAPLSGPAELVV